MRKKIFLPALAAASALTMIVSPAVASAANTLPTPLAGYGFDGNAHLVVGGGSTTVYKIAQGLANLYNSTASCATNSSAYNASTDPAPGSTSGSAQSYPQTSPAFNQCSPSTQSYSGVDAGGNYDGDTIAIAAPNGSSTGIASLNADHGSTNSTYAYEGTNENLPTTGDPNSTSGYTNGYGTVDFALSSRAAKTSGGNCSIGQDELQCDTFWGVAADGVEVFTWGTTGDETNTASSNGLTAADLYNIYSCNYTTWGQVPAEQADPSAFPPAAAPIVPWSMNSNSGTYSDFDNYVSANDGSFGSLTADTKAGYYSGGSGSNPAPVGGNCVRELNSADNTLPLENDVKPIINDVIAYQGGISTSLTSTNNPANWIWFGSYGLLSAYQYLSQPKLAGIQYNTYPVPINGTLPSTSGITGGTYPIPRVLSLVTKKTDADCPVYQGACDFTNASGTDAGPTNGNGVADLNVTGGTSGVSGAIREFIRFVCRDKAESLYNGSYAPVDPYTGTPDITEIASVYTASGFAALPTADKTPGSNCDVTSVG